MVHFEKVCVARKKKSFILKSVLDAKIIPNTVSDMLK